MTVLWVALAGGAGATARFLLDTVVRAHWGTRFPYGTLVVNVSGSLVLGVLTGLVLFHGQPSELTTVAGTGFCGGYTTFSTASFETVRLFQLGRTTAALLNAVGTLLLSVGVAGLGLALVSVFG